MALRYPAQVDRRHRKEKRGRRKKVPWRLLPQKCPLSSAIGSEGQKEKEKEKNALASSASEMSFIQCSWKRRGSSSKYSFW
jgi:hypothetical protein